MATTVVTRGSEWGEVELNSRWGEGPMGFENRMTALAVERFEQLAQAAGYPVSWFPSLSEVHGDADLDVEPETLEALREQAGAEVWRGVTEDAGPLADQVREKLLPGREGIELLVIYPQMAAKAWEILGEDAYQFGDNGGDPDGPSYYRPADGFDAGDVDSIVSAHLGHVEYGWREEGYTGSDADRQRMAEIAPNRWCGYSSDRELYYITKD
jgi:hypothetical protein